MQTETVMAISRHALMGSTPPKAIKLHARLQGHEVLMLVDSGSSTSFLDERLSVSLTSVVPLPHPCELCYFSHVPSCIWTSQAQEFVTNMKVLPLGSYDAILGMDWFEDRSPMNADWRGKQMLITTAQGPAHLIGHSSGPTACTTINNL